MRCFRAAVTATGHVASVPPAGHLSPKCRAVTRRQNRRDMGRAAGRCGDSGGDQPADFGTRAMTANIVSAIVKRSSRAAWWIVDTNPCRSMGES